MAIVTGQRSSVALDALKSTQPTVRRDLTTVMSLEQ